MTEPTFHLMIPEAGRADVLLAGMIDGLTRSAAQRWLEEGRVVLEGRPVKKNARLEPGQVLSVTPPQPEAVDVIPQDIPLDVVYEDGDVIVVNKPVGMVVHPAPGHPDGTLVNALLYHCENSLSGIDGQLRPGIVHRIDRDTSGLVIAAKTTAPTWPWQSSFRTTPCSASTTRWCWGAFGMRRARWTPPSPAIPQTGSGWRCAAPDRAGRRSPTIR